MGLAHRVQPHVGVQFHPESYMTQGGKRMLANFLRSAGIAAERRGRPGHWYTRAKGVRDS